MSEIDMGDSMRGNALRWQKLLVGATVSAVSSGVVTVALALTPETVSVPRFIAPGSDLVLPEKMQFEDETGTLEVFNEKGPIATKGHPFFEPLAGGNGRACVSCHQPADAMGLSVKTIRERWQATKGKDPMFAAQDGSNCPDLPQQDSKSHSLLLDHGLFRTSLPWPGRNEVGGPIEPEFSIEVVSDPTGCNTSPRYGLKSANPRISVYRRPRMTANLKFLEPEHGYAIMNVRTGEVLPIDPERGVRVGGNLGADSRWLTLNAQMLDAMGGHMQGGNTLPAHMVPSKALRDQIRAFEMQIYAAQVEDRKGGSLREGGASGGPEGMASASTTLFDPAASNTGMFPQFDAWETLASVSGPNAKQPVFLQINPRHFVTNEKREGEDTETPSQKAYRDSVARGYASFSGRPITIRDVGSLNPYLGNPYSAGCEGCHDVKHMGLDGVPGFLDVGFDTLPFGDPRPDLPLFKLTCRADVIPHPYKGRVIYTRDPGRALISGRCQDIGARVASQLRGLAARAPYFAGGSAKTLLEVVEFYDRRFNIGYSEQEKEDLVNFLGAL